MNDIQDFDNFLLKLDREINAHPSEKYLILLRTLKNTNCPYLKRRVKAQYLREN